MSAPSFCEHCGAALKPNARFCPKCGKAVQPPPRPPARADIPPTQMAPQMAPQKAPGAYTPPTAPMADASQASFSPLDVDASFESAPTPWFKNPLVWVAAAALLACVFCLVGAIFVVREAGDILDFGDEIEEISSVVPDFEEIVTQIPEFEEIATQVPEFEEIATQVPEFEQITTSLPDLEQLATDLPLPIPLPEP